MNLEEPQMASPSDEKLYEASYEDEFPAQFETPYRGSMGAEIWGSDLSGFSGHDRSFEIGVHSNDAYHPQYQPSEPHYIWNCPSIYGQEGGSGGWAGAALPEDRWSYVDVDYVGMCGSDGQEASLVSDTVESQSTYSAYGGTQPQLGESTLAGLATPFQQHVDWTYESTASREDLSPQPQNLTASAKAGVPQYTSFRASKQAILPKYWHCPVDDPTIPKTDADRQRYIGQLLTALNNVEDTIGVQGHSFKKRWYDPSKGYSPYYTPLVKEALCWLILSQAESLHMRGPSKTFISFDPNFWTAARRTCRWKFSERLDAIAELLATSKSKCDALLGGGSLQLVVANPGQRLRATKADVRQNEKRKELLETVKCKERLNKKAKVGAEEDWSDHSLPVTCGQGWEVGVS